MKLTKEEIEIIIADEIVVDCYTEEVNMGWAIYMEENLHYPFEAEYLVKKKSGKSQWRKVSVVNNETDESNFDGNSYYVEIELDEIIIPARLDELKIVKADEETMETLQVWKSRTNY